MFWSFSCEQKTFVSYDFNENGILHINSFICPKYLWKSSNSIIHQLDIIFNYRNVYRILNMWDSFRCRTYRIDRKTSCKKVYECSHIFLLFTCVHITCFELQLLINCNIQVSSIWKNIYIYFSYCRFAVVIHFMQNGQSWSRTCQFPANLRLKFL